MTDLAELGGWAAVLRLLVSGQDLSSELAAGALHDMLDGRASESQIAAFLVGMRIKGETSEEVSALVDAMLEMASPLEIDDPDSVVDIVGTGGSPSLAGKAFNVSTMASIVAAGAGARICKHGNRRASSTSGSTDLLEALGVEVELDGNGVAACMRESGVGFAFARVFHPSMRHVAKVRGDLGVPTVFNVLGPLSHPGRVGRQLIGVADPALLDLVPEVLARRGLRRAWVVNGLEHLDELTTTGASTVVELRDGELRRFELHASEMGLRPATIDEIGVGGPEDNARAAASVVSGEPGPHRDMVVLNAGAALVVADLADDLEAGVRKAEAAIDDGSAADVLARLVATSQAMVADERDADAG